MTSVGIMTWLHNRNYGTVLQAYALQRYLRSCDYEVTNIDFNASSAEKIRNLIRCGNSPKLFLEKISIAMTNASADGGKLKLKEERFNKFLTDNFNLTDRIYTYKELEGYSNIYDKYICGSDQIWSPTLLNPPYYFDFVTDDRKKIAYACSFGVGNVPEKKKQIIADYLKRYDHISVREQSGQKIVKELTDLDVPTTVDPVFLLDSSEWDTIAADNLIGHDYIFAYYLTYNRGYIKAAKKIAAYCGIDLVMVPAAMKEYRVDAELIQDAGPSEWISLIKNAKAVLTDSFHGCVFSLIYKKPLMIFKRFSDSSKTSQNSRIYTLVDQYDLEDNIAEEFDENQAKRIIEKTIDVKSAIETNADRSKKWLMNALME